MALCWTLFSLLFFCALLSPHLPPLFLSSVCVWQGVWPVFPWLQTRNIWLPFPAHYSAIKTGLNTTLVPDNSALSEVLLMLSLPVFSSVMFSRVLLSAFTLLFFCVCKCTSLLRILQCLLCTCVFVCSAIVLYSAAFSFAPSSQPAPCLHRYNNDNNFNFSALIKTRRQADNEILLIKNKQTAWTQNLPI